MNREGRNILIAAIIGTILGVGIFFAWRSAHLPKIESPESHVAAFPASEAELKVGEYFDLRGRKEVLITIESGEFNPKIILADKGVKVFWKNTDSIQHAVSITDQWKVLHPNEAFSVVFDVPGNYQSRGDSDTIKGLIIIK